MKLNEAQIQEKWAPALRKAGVKESARSWVASYAHYHALNESAGHMSSLSNVPGMGDVRTGQPAVGSAQFSGPGAQGSGDKFPALLPMALQVAARTVGFDIVNVVPQSGPTGVISYLDYVYAGDKQPYGAKPAYNAATANPAGFTGQLPYVFKLNLKGVTGATNLLAIAAGTAVTFTGASGVINTTFIGKSRIDASMMFRIETTGTTALSLGVVFEGDVAITDGTTTVNLDDTNKRTPSLISTLEDQIQGYAGAGANDDQQWGGTYVSGTTLYEPMSRGTGENQYARQLGLQVFTKFIQVGTYQVSVNVTQEQIQDLNKQWGIDILSMVEDAGINEISQSINKHILSTAFALGWKNHVQANESEGVNLNLDMTSNVGGTNTLPYVYTEDGAVIPATMTIPGFVAVAGSTTNFENEDTAIKRIMARVLAAGNLIAQRGRRGPANFIVTNTKMATAMQSAAGYAIAPLQNTITQTNGSLYPMGTISGMSLMVDPNMAYDDTRILVGRKGLENEPGLLFCPYLLAESFSYIANDVPRVVLKSRYVLTESGFHPQSQYVTLYVKTSEGAII